MKDFPAAHMGRRLAEVDPEVAAILKRELARQERTLVLIPSENYASRAVLEATASVMTNKYAEGYPGRRYYNGCAFVDEVETLACERAKALFGAEWANVQPHSGTQGNTAAYLALLEPGDGILALSLTCGGHLSHGQELNVSGKWYKVNFYECSCDGGEFDLEEVRRLAKKHRPRMIVVGASAYPRKIDFAPWREIADEVGAYLLADIAHVAGMVVAGLHPSPVPYADVVSTTTHKTLRGPRGAVLLCREKYARAIDRAVFPGVQAGPLMHVIAAKAVAFHEAAQPEFKEYQRRIIENARALAQGLIEEGFKLVTGGTDNHLLLVDVRPLGIDGKVAADILEEAGITLNKNTIPGETGTPWRPSGIRLGSPAVTTRGMGTGEMREIARLIAQVLRAPEDAALRRRVRKRVEELCDAFPIYPWLA